MLATFNVVSASCKDSANRACLSPAYLQSEYCQWWEFVEYLKYEIGHLHGFNSVAPICFVEVPGWGSKGFEQVCGAWVTELRKRQHFDLRSWHDQGEEALRESAVQEHMGKLNRQIIDTITRGERAEISLGNVDAHNPHLIGRTAASEICLNIASDISSH